MGSFERSLAFGRVGESVISRWLQGRGHLVFPAYEKELGAGKGPQLFSAAGDLVLPDLLAFRDGAVRWFEAKHKTCFTWHRLSGRWTTGIDLRHYGEYQEVMHRTGAPVWLLFWHPMAEPSPGDRAHGCPPCCPTGLFGNDLAVLVKSESHKSDRHGKSGMVYWAVESLRLLADAQELAA
jgi:hypothetical protein